MGDFSKYVETKEIKRTGSVDTELNPWLAKGWEIVHIWTTDHGDPNFRLETAHFLLGWPRQENPPSYPKIPAEEKLEWE